MKVVIVNASLKEKDSVSSLLIERFVPFLKDCEYGILPAADCQMNRKTVRSVLRAADAFLIVTPVSCGGLPSFLSGLMSEMEFHAGKQNIPLCTVIHGEEYDPSSYQHALNQLKIWSEKCHLHQCMNVLIGGSDELRFLKDVPAGNRTMRKTDHAFAELADALKGAEKPDFSFSTGSSFLYKRTMERYWKKELYRHGLEKSDAFEKINENSFTEK